MTSETRKFLKNFDIAGDEVFNLDEFVLFLVFLSMPLKDMQSIFVLMDADGSGELDKQACSECCLVRDVAADTHCCFTSGLHS